MISYFLILTSGRRIPPYLINILKRCKVNRVTVQRGIKKNDLKARAMQHHGLIYRQGQVSFQRSSPEREKNISTNSSIQSEENDCSRIWDLKMSKKFIFTARSDGKLEKWSVGKRLEMVKCVYVAPRYVM